MPTDPTHSTPPPSNAPEPPSDHTTLVAVIQSYRDAGYVTDFFAEEDGRVRCSHCSSVMAADQLPMQSMRRLEGASDPADMLSVVATTCPVCGADGTMVLGYGTNASQGDAMVSRAMNDRRSDAALPGDSAPAELPGE